MKGKNDLLMSCISKRINLFVTHVVISEKNTLVPL